MEVIQLVWVNSPSGYTHYSEVSNFLYTVTSANGIGTLRVSQVATDPSNIRVAVELFTLTGFAPAHHAQYAAASMEDVLVKASHAGAELVY